MALNAGVLMIGSLFWDKTRESWRQARLDTGFSALATAPIRYGRRSESRGNTFTMVFSRLSPAGQARVLQCRHTVSSVEDLIYEAEQLWAAERNRPAEGRISAAWGCVVLLPNPNREISTELLEGWAARVSKESSYGNVPQTQDEGCLVSASGILQIAWPRLTHDNTDLPLDLLLATATYPSLQGNPPAYPSAEAIAVAWKEDRKGHIEYFRENQRHGICTFQDADIRAELERT